MTGCRRVVDMSVVIAIIATLVLAGGAPAAARQTPPPPPRPPVPPSTIVTEDRVEQLRLAADKGDAQAQKRLGDLYSGGAGVAQDAVQAVLWYRKAAEQGDAPAQFNLALLMYGGVGTLKDFVGAYKWFNIAAARAAGDSRQFYADGRDAVAKQMTTEQIADAQKQSREWVDAFDRRMSAPPPPPPPSPVHVGGSIPEPTRTRFVAPVYSALAQAAKVQGIVMIEATIGPDGRVLDAKVLRSVPLLDQAALDAVKQWEFTPTRIGGVAVPVVMSVTVTFSLK
jgi:TonB family protein